MKIAVLKEGGAETRVAAIPETVKKFVGLGASVAVERGAGTAASISDSDDDRPLEERLDALAIQFEAEHPALGTAIRRVVDALGKAGI